MQAGYSAPLSGVNEVPARLHVSNGGVQAASQRPSAPDGGGGGPRLQRIFTGHGRWDGVLQGACWRGPWRRKGAIDTDRTSHSPHLELVEACLVTFLSTKPTFSSHAACTAPRYSRTPFFYNRLIPRVGFFFPPLQCPTARLSLSTTKTSTRNLRKWHPQAPVCQPTILPTCPSSGRCCATTRSLTTHFLGRAAAECVSDEALIHLKTYKYSAVDKSPVSKYILGPWVRCKTPPPLSRDELKVFAQNNLH